MNSSKLISDKRNSLVSLRDLQGIDKVLLHLEVAEKHFDRGYSEDDNDAYTDVIYRTNQVFEGILKEAYEVLSGKSGDRTTPAKIENYFQKGNVFKSRVIDYFTQYRRNWRNPSTHDHRLDFSEQEAFLAISTVTAFCFVVIDQMVLELARLKALKSETPHKKIDLSSGEGLAFALSESLPELLKMKEITESSPEMTELYILGILDGFMEGLMPEVEIQSEPEVVSGNRTFKPDILALQNEKKLIVEVKRTNWNSIGRAVRSVKKKLLDSLDGLDADFAVGVIVPSKVPIKDPIGYEVIKESAENKHILVVKPVNESDDS